MISEQLVELDELLPVLLEPAGEALVQIGPDALRQRVVGRVSEQEMVKAERFLTRKLRLVGADQPLARERGQPRHHLPVGRERLHGAAVEDLALDRPALEHRALVGVELVEAGGEQRPERGRDGDLALRLAGHRHHLGEEERVAAGGAGDPLAQVVVEALPAAAPRPRPPRAARA